MSKKIIVSQSSRLLIAVKIGLFACIFMPLISQGKFIFPYIFPKQLFFQIIIEMVFLLYIFLAFKRPEFRPRSSKMFLAVSFYFVFMFLSMIFGVNIFHSFWSNFERMAGFVNLIHYFGFFVVAANVFKTKSDWHSFFDFSVFAGFLEALYAFGQILGVNSLNHGSGSRIDGTIGNTSFLAGYMLINAFFAFWLMSQKRKKNWSVFYSAAIILNLFVMYQTQTRGALLAFFAGALVLAGLAAFAPAKGMAQIPWRLGGHLRKIALGGLILVILFVGSIFIFKNSSFVKNSPSLKRFSQISLNDNTTQTRLLAWKLSIKGFAERPLFGWGQENYNIVFNKYYDPLLYPTENWFDRAHNAYVDVLIHNGLVGFAAYLSIFALSFWFLWRAWRRDLIDYPTMAIFSVVILAYAIQNIFLFDTQVTLLMIFLIWSFIAYLSFGLKEKDGDLAQKPFQPNFLLKAALIAVFAIFFYSVNLPAVSTSAQGIEALVLFQSDFGESIKKFKSSFATDTFGVPEVAGRAYELGIQVTSSEKFSREDKKEMIETAAEGMKIALEKEPQNARLIMILGNLYLASAVLDSSYLSDAEYYLQKSFQLSPSRQELIFAIGQLKIYQGKTEEALSLFKKAVDLNPKAAPSHWNLGIISISFDDKKEGEEAIKKAIALGHSYNSSDIKLLINAYSNIGDWQKVISLYKELIILTPIRASAYAGLAAAYAEAGDKPKAKAAAQKAIELDPFFQAEGEEFIRRLGL